MANFTKYFIRRVLQTIPSLIGLSMLIFFISRVLPGAPVKLALGPEATEERVAEYREELGLNDPIWEQYINWLIGAVQGEWGVSIRIGEDAFTTLVGLAPATIELVLFAVIYATILAVPLGVMAGTNKDHFIDHFSRFAALFGVSMPRFWVAIILQLVFFGMLGWLPLTGRFPGDVPPPKTITGLYLVDSLIRGQLDKFWMAFRHILLPGVALGTGTLAQVTRLTRSEMIEEQQKDYILMARSAGLPANLIKYKYMLKNAFTSSLTIMGLAFGVLLGGAFFVEIIFQWPGMARFGVSAITFLDFNVIVGLVIIIGMGFLFANLVVDLLYGYLDPRIRLGED